MKTLNNFTCFAILEIRDGHCLTVWLMSNVAGLCEIIEKGTDSLSACGGEEYKYSVQEQKRNGIGNRSTLDAYA